MSNWRPEGWENFYKTAQEEIVAEAKEHNLTLPESVIRSHGPIAGAFEAGADAMLKAISEKIEKNMMLTDDEMYAFFAQTKGDTMSVFEIIRYMNLKQSQKILALISSKK
jgi:hypothetical protein